LKLRRSKRTPFRPRAPRIDATRDRAEEQLFDQAFNESLWRRPTPFF
jgi:hypothetical protein